MVSVYVCVLCMNVSMHGECMCMRVCEYTGGVRPQGGWDLPRPAEGHQGWGVTRSKVVVEMGGPRGAEEDGRTGAACRSRLRHTDSSSGHGSHRERGSTGKGRNQAGLKYLLGARVGVGRGKTGARSLWVSSRVRLGRMTPALGDLPPPRKEVPGATFTVCNVQVCTGRRAWKNQFSSQLFLKTSVKCRAVSEEQHQFQSLDRQGLAHRQVRLPPTPSCPVTVPGLAGTAGRELFIKGGVSASLMVATSMVLRCKVPFAGLSTCVIPIVTLW